ncbi:hypothetical protein [[Bacillus] enclensis]|uniref:hypothetical protein n=1 Tax=[Bacillus] enclensis TaxID=1402860 RepID=UPI0018DCC34F|nr:hypothetical protein [[Bacillus] enclensis]MBH9968475.1 hypothetical protein [[Bacillus] enclensis]
MPKVNKIVKKEIKNRKNWNERIEISRHIAQYKSEEYYYVLYLNLIGIPKGAFAIRSDGTVPELSIAKKLSLE